MMIKLINIIKITMSNYNKCGLKNNKETFKKINLIKKILLKWINGQKIKESKINI